MPTINKLDVIASELIRKNEALGYEMKRSVILRAKEDLLNVLLG